MSSAPTYDHWNALRLTVTALIAEAVLNPARAFFRAVREAKAQAVALVFALARWMDEGDETRPDAPLREGRLSRRGGGGRGLLADDLWRNPPVMPVRLERETTSLCGDASGRGPPKTPSVTAALLTLRQILDLCADPDRYAARLSRRIVAVDTPLAVAEAKAFAIQARAQARRNREARRALDRGWRGRRRARRETG